MRLTDAEYREYKRQHPGTDLPQDAGVKMKSGAAHATAKTGRRVLGIAHNGYWTNAHVLAQCKIAVRVFEAKHPNDKIGRFLFEKTARVTTLMRTMHSLRIE